MAQIFSSFVVDDKKEQWPNDAVMTKTGDFLAVGVRSGITEGLDTAIAVLFLGLSTYKQKAYHSTYARALNGVAQLADGGFIAVGTSDRSSGDRYLWVTELDADLEQKWEKEFGSPETETHGIAVAATSDGGFVVLAHWLSRIGGPALTRILKFAADRSLQWSGAYKDCRMYSILQTDDGGYICSGGVELSQDHWKLVAMRLSANGSSVWFKSYDPEVDLLNQTDLTQTSDGNFVIVTWHRVCKIDGQGNLLWSQSGVMSLWGVAELEDGTLAVSGVQEMATAEGLAGYGYLAVLSADGSDILWDNVDPFEGSSIDIVLPIGGTQIVTIGTAVGAVGQKTYVSLAGYSHETVMS